MKKYNRYEAWYMDQLGNIIENGQRRGDRTGTGVISQPNLSYTHDLRESYPLMFGRQFVYDQPITEMIWMMSGSSNIQYLKDNGCPFWNGFAVKDGQVTEADLTRMERLKILADQRGMPLSQVGTLFGNIPLAEIDEELDKQQIPNMVNAAVGKIGELGPVYGVMWRYWPNPDGTTFDQLAYALRELQKNPNNRRIVVDCWNPSFLPDPKIKPADNAAKGKMALTPCHFAFGFYTWEIPFHERAELLIKEMGAEGNKFYPIRNEDRSDYELLFEIHGIPEYYLDINFTMRSNDWILGQPANMNMYSAMNIMFAQQCNMVPRFVNYTGWDSHVYTNHLEGAAELQKRWESGIYKYQTVGMHTNKKDDLFGYHKSDFQLIGDYNPGEKIKFPIAI
ncbi:putative thymidylate synthase [Pseudomonas phage OBP]|uniref:putative thymidylate synthase n=1 Tax=Pseudomonas phage OBP TaxID=1124849 RepID=UPI000240D5CE|nr:putative thymidylate synthase [Pseudomonas phage OBP]AEV89671.1 putative thymidylate synthase [Pseudomonas phage OBP]